MIKRQLAFAREIGIFHFLYRQSLWQWYKRILRTPVTVRLPTGYALSAPFIGTASEVFVTNCDIDWGGEKLLLEHTTRVGVFIDVGANIGYYSLYLAPAAHEVWAFEPDPIVLPSLRSNASQAPNVRVIPKALFKEAARLRFVSGGGGSGYLTQCLDTKGLEIDTTTLDAEWALRGRPHVDCIKIDAEGWDFDVLCGAQELVVHSAPLIYTEMNNRADLSQMLEWAHSRGYAAFAHHRRCPGDATVAFSRFASITDFRDMYWKMLFLVPHSLVYMFGSYCSSLAK